MTPNGFDVLTERGFVQQVTDAEAVRGLFGVGPVVVYVGYDGTADSLHVGNLFTLMALAQLERLGHTPIVVLGGGTSRVGDPSGKTEMRKMLDGVAIAHNLERFAHQVSRFLDVKGGRTRVVDNGEWLLELKYIDFLREIGSHFSVNRMLSAEAYRLRMERGLSFIEFNYQLLQAYDFLQLRRRYGCVLQMGGDDQWGNILAGVELCRRVDQQTVYGLTQPLLLTAAGQKMGKTAAGAVWLDPERLSPYDYYQYWVNTHDDDVARFLGFFTFLPMDEIRAVADLSGRDQNAAKSVLAYEATCFVHGEAAAREAHAAAQAAFGSRPLPPDILPSSTVDRGGATAQEQMPTLQLSAARVAAGLGLVELLVETGLATSKNEARRLIRQQAIRLNDDKARDEQQRVTVADFAAGPLVLRAGKKKVHRVILD